MKPLVYTTAFGEDHFFQLAEQMFRSLRKRGYSGDAAILCDRDPGLPSELGVETILLENIQNFPLLKARLPQVRDVSGYDRILFVDTDVVFLREPGPLFELAAERMAVSRDHCPLSRNHFNLTFFSAENRRGSVLSGTRSINTGVLVFPGNRYPDYCSHWLEAWNSPEIRRRLATYPMTLAELRDQPILQNLLYEGNWDCAFIPDHLLLMPLFFTENEPLHESAALLHLNGSSRTPQQKHKLIAIMADLNELDAFEDIRNYCLRLQSGRRRISFPCHSQHNTHKETEEYL